MGVNKRLFDIFGRNPVKDPFRRVAPPPKPDPAPAGRPAAPTLFDLNDTEEEAADVHDRRSSAP